MAELVPFSLIKRPESRSDSGTVGWPAPVVPRETRMWLRSAARTDVGMRRLANEDRYSIVPDLGLFLVADGIGGHKAGQVASQLAAEATIRAIEALEGATVSLAERLRHAVACANREIFRAA